MGGCAAINCTNHTRNGYRVHRFPSDEVRARFWAEQCGRATDWNPSKKFKLCEVHFDEKQYELYRADGRKLLKWNAVPTIFNFDESMSKLGKKGRKKNNSKAKYSSEVNNASNSGNIHVENVSYNTDKTKLDHSYMLSELVAENIICELNEDIENEVTFVELDIVPKNTSCESNEILDDVSPALRRISSENLSHELDPFREDISCNLNQSVEDAVCKSTTKGSRRNRGKNNSRKKNLSGNNDASNSENVFHNRRKTKQDHSYVLSEIASKNIRELNECTESEVLCKKRKITTKHTSCESNRILDDVTYTLHRISSENLSRELDHLREDISCNLYQSVEDSAFFEIENVPFVVDDDAGEKDVCPLNECEEGCTHKAIIENYKTRILELEDKLASMEDELTATKAQLKTGRRKKTS